MSQLWEEEKKSGDKGSSQDQQSTLSLLYGTSLRQEPGRHVLGYGTLRPPSGLAQK